jgi:hypothetical protein
MVTGEASYARVAEAAESALDGYLLKPHNATTLAQRVHQARHRKFLLRDIFEAIEAEDFEAATRHCMARFHSKGKYWLYAARIGAELLLRLNRHDEARMVFEAVTETNALPWSRLGIARAQAEAGKLPLATRTLETLLSEEPSYTDAYDVMGRVQVEQGDLEQALATYRKATALTPSSIARLQKQGMLAFFMGQRDEAAQLLDRAVTLGITSKMFDYQSLVLLALTHFDRRDSKGLARCHDNIAHMQQKIPKSDRLRRFAAVVGIFKELMARQLAQVVVSVRELAGEIRRESFDFEAACNLLAALARIRSAEIQLPDAEIWITTLARRYCVTKATTELMAHACSLCPEYSEILRAEQVVITNTAEQAMAHSLAGNPREAAKSLLDHGAQMLNAKLIDIARLVLQRHRARIPDADEMLAKADDLRKRFCAGGTQAQLGSTSGRQAGGLALRTANSGERPPADEPVESQIEDVPSAG